MHTSHLTFEKLPAVIPVFPLTGVLLLPHGQLPLNIFEPRYLTMVDDAMAGSRIIGMIQPKAFGKTTLYETGCAGRIINFSETDDGRYLITLAGLCRFKIAHEHDTPKPYRSVSPDWAPYNQDMDRQDEKVAIDRIRLNTLLQNYFRKQEMSCDWEKVDIAPDADLLTALAMICPLGPSEKQALLESENIKTRTELFMTLIEMAGSDCAKIDDDSCH